MSVFDLATNAAFKSIKLVRGVSATYTVDLSTSHSITVVPAQTTRPNVDAEGYVSSKREQDFLVEAADIDSAEPMISHTITVNSEVYGLVQMGEEKCFRFHDAPNNTVYRIHTELLTSSKVPG